MAPSICLLCTHVMATKNSDAEYMMGDVHLPLAVTFGVLAALGLGAGITGAVLTSREKDVSHGSGGSTAAIHAASSQLKVNDVFRMTTNMTSSITSPFVGDTVYMRAFQTGSLTTYFLGSIPSNVQLEADAALFRVTAVSSPPTTPYLEDTVGSPVGYIFELYEDPILKVGSKYTPSQNWTILMGLVTGGNTQFYYISPGNTAGSFARGPVEFGFAPSGATNLFSAGPEGVLMGHITPFWPASNMTGIYDMQFYTPSQSTGEDYPFAFTFAFHYTPGGGGGNGGGGAAENNTSEEGPSPVNPHHNTYKILEYVGFIAGGVCAMVMIVFAILTARSAAGRQRRKRV